VERSNEIEIIKTWNNI